jgi:ABC-type transport system involved in multi-copper enzyme maturation permease subunit
VAVTAPGVLRSVIGAALYVTVAGMIGLALGTLLRNTAAGISTFVGVFFVIPPLTALLPASVSDHLTKYLPSNAGEALWSGSHGPHSAQSALSPWTGFALLCGYAVILIAAAAWRLRSADA